MSHARAHFMRASAAAISAAVGVQQEQTTGNAYELMLLKLAEDRRRLKGVQSIERKAEVKRQLLPEYEPWIEGVIAGDSGRQDDVFMTVLVWHIDIGDLAAALPLAEYAIRHDMAMPDQYKRSTACVLAEEAAAIAIKNGTVELQALQQVASLTESADMPDEVRAKLCKAIGYAQRESGELKAARDSLARALQLHEKSGVKKDIERLDVIIKNSAGETGGAG